MLALLIIGLIVICALSGWWLLSVFLGLFFWWRYSIWPLVVISILLDGYYGSFFTLPILSLSLIVLAGIEVVCKPWLLLYNDENVLVQKNQSPTS